MDFASSTRAAENRTRWKGIVENLSVVPLRPSKVMGEKRIEQGTITNTNTDYMSSYYTPSRFIYICNEN